MATEAWLTYELITREIFDLLQNQSSVKNVDVRHNVTLRGKTEKHKIDVYWEFESGGIVHSVVVNAKDWGGPVKKEQILTLKAVLDDLPRRPRGIVVTRYGYQRGARNFAARNGIDIFQLVEPETTELTWPVGAIVTAKARKALNEDTSRRINTSEVEVVFTSFRPSLVEWNWKCDQLWVQEQHAQLGDELYEELRSIRFTAPIHSFQLYNEAGEPTDTLRTLLWPMVEDMKAQQESERTVDHKFAAPTYVRTESKMVPLVKLAGMAGTLLLIEEEAGIMPMYLKGFTTFILRNVLDGDEWQIAIPEPTGT